VEKGKHVGGREDERNQKKKGTSNWGVGKTHNQIIEGPMKRVDYARFKRKEERNSREEH